MIKKSLSLMVMVLRARLKSIIFESLAEQNFQNNPYLTEVKSAIKKQMFLSCFSSVFVER
jgi:phage gp16-like protein